MITALVAGLAGACTEKPTKVHLAVAAKTNQGEPVPAALVLLDGKKIGATGEDGRFQAALELPAKSKKRLEVRKDSDVYYFAPYFESFTVASAGPQDEQIGATLYFVPKPGATGASSKPAATWTQAPAPASVTTDLTSNSTKNRVPTPITVDETTASDAEISAAVAAAEADATAPVRATPIAAAPVVLDAESATGTTGDKSVDSSGAVVAGVAKAGAVAEQEGLHDKSATESTVEELAAAPGAELAAAYPGEVGEPLSDKAAPQSQGKFIFTVHVLSGATPLPGAEVAIGEDGATALKTACQSNARGRCVIHFPTRPEKTVTFVARKAGYKTVTVNASVKLKDKLRLNLAPGRSLDIYALTQIYNHSAGLPGVEVVIMGKSVGVTDQFGRFSSVYTGKPDDLINISLKTRGYLPEVFETDFVAAGAMSLVKYFTPALPPPLRVAVLKPVAAGAMDASGRSTISTELDGVVQSAARRFLFASSAFSELPFARLDAAMHKAGKTTGELLNHGWQETDIKASVDALLVPTVIGGDRPVLELSLVSSSGHVTAAAKEELSGLGDKAAIEQAVAAIAKKIVRVYPFEGAVLAKEVSQGKSDKATRVTINLGQARGRGVKVGDSLDVYGLQTEKSGRRQARARIGTLVVREVKDATATAQLSWTAPRASVERGDLVILRPRQAPASQGAQLVVTTTKGEETVALGQANVYLNDVWLGATGDDGRLALDSRGSGTLRIIKQGFAAYRQPVEIKNGEHLSATLAREAAFLRVASEPAGAVVKVDGKSLGKTPLLAPVAVASGFVKLELSGVPGYKTYSSVLELDSGTLDLSGEEQIVLERDELAVARAQLKAGKVEAALATLNSVPKDHSDYLSARHEAGEIYLTKLDQPAKAAEAFGQVTANEAVKEFNDKRFIASHIDEGIALFLTAEKLAVSQPDAARAHYQKALSVLDGVLPYLRFVDAKEYPQAVHNVYYHRALCQHRLWVQTQDPRMLSAALKSWRSYLNGSARTVPVDGVSRTYVDNAEVYMKQASASLSSARNVSRQ